MGVSIKKKQTLGLCESRDSKSLGTPSANVVVGLAATVLCTPGTAAAPRCLQVYGLPRMLSASLPLAMLPRSDLRLSVLSYLKLLCSFLAPQGLRSNFWDQISGMARQTLIYDCALLCPRGCTP